MLQHIDITGINIELEDDIKRYVRRKIGKLDRLVPRQARPEARAEVRIKFLNEKHGNKYECEVLVHLPDEQITAKDSTMNQFAAVDIVEEKLKNVLRKYKEKHQGSAKAGGGILGRFRRRVSDERETDIIE